MQWLAPIANRAIRFRAQVGIIARVVFMGKTLYSHIASLHPDRGDGLASHPGIVAILLVSFMLQKRDKLQQSGPVSPKQLSPIKAQYQIIIELL